MQLNKFGAILTFGIEMEQQAVRLYRAAAEAEPSDELEQSAAAARKRLLRLQMMRRELVNEMLLEPIDGFDRPALPALAINSTKIEHIREQKAQIERTRRQFYATASAKIATVAPAVSRAFRKMAEEL